MARPGPKISAGLRLRRGKLPRLAPKVKLITKLNVPALCGKEPEPQPLCPRCCCGVMAENGPRLQELPVCFFPRSSRSAAATKVLPAHLAWLTCTRRPLRSTGTGWPCRAPRCGRSAALGLALRVGEQAG